MKTKKTIIRGTFIVLVTLISLFTFITLTKAAAPPEPTGKPIIIGCAIPLKFMYGMASLRSATLAVEEINAAGGVNIGGVNHPFKLVVADTRDTEPGTPISEALIVVEKLILGEGARFFIGGPNRSEAALAAMDLFSKYKAIAIYGSGSLSPAIHKRVADNYEKFKYIFRETGEAGWLVKENTYLLEDLQKRFGFNKVYIIVSDVAHARAGGDITAKVLEEKGWAILGKDRYPIGSSDFSSSLLKAKEKGAQVLFVWHEQPDALILVKQYHDLKIPAFPFGSVLTCAEPFETWKETEGKCEYWTSNMVNAGACYANFNPWVVRWWNAYIKRWGKEPEQYCVQVPYTSIYVFKDAIERAGTFEDTDKVIKALENTDLKDTPQGRIRFDPKSHQVIPSLDPKEGAVGSIMQWQAGKRVPIFPSQVAIGEIKLPPWIRMK